jgi:diacylglycerol O-acyltransferase 1
MNTATVTSLESSESITNRRLQTPAPLAQENNQVDKKKALSLSKRGFRSKYRHVAAVHAKTTPSCLSHDALAAPSFLGFRNLMVIVLGTFPLLPLLLAADRPSSPIHVHGSTVPCSSAYNFF